MTTTSGATSEEEVLEMLRDSARAIALSDGVAVVRRYGDQVAYVGEDAITPLWTGQRFPIHTCISGLAMLARQPILIPDILKDPRVPLNAYLSTFVRSMAMFPIGTGEPGPVTRAVQTLFEDALHGRAEQYRSWLDPVPVPASTS